MAEHTKACWVVLGSSGEYSDWSQWVVEVHASEQAAKDRVGSLSSEMRQLWSKRPKPHYVTCVSDPAFEAWEKRVHLIDPQANGYGETNYTAVEAPFVSGRPTKERP